MLSIFVLFVLATGFHYSTPIVIDTGFYDQSFKFLYNSDLQLIFTANQNYVSMYDLNGNLVRTITLDFDISDMMIIKKPAILISVHPHNNLHEYDLNGRYLNFIPICGYNYRSFLIPSDKSNNYYLISDLAWIYNLYSFNKDNNAINETLVDRGIAARSKFYPGYVTGNILAGMSNIFTIYDYELNIIMRVKFPYPEYDIFKSFELDNDTVCIFYYGKFYIYSYDGHLLNTFVYENIDGMSIMSLRFNQRHHMMTIIQTDNENIPFIKFIDLSGQLIYELNYGDNRTSSYYNINVIVDEKTDIIIGNINSKIKIWKPIP